MNHSDVGILLYRKDYDKWLSDIEKFVPRIEEVERFKDFITKDAEIRIGFLENDEKFIFLQWKDVPWNDLEFPYVTIIETVRKNGEFLRIGEEISDIVHEGYGDFEDTYLLGVSRNIVLN